MAKFGRFEFGKGQPAEVYEGDYMTTENAYVRIWQGDDPGAFATAMFNTPRLLHAIHLDKGQSVRLIDPPESGKANKDRRERHSTSASRSN